MQGAPLPADRCSRPLARRCELLRLGCRRRHAAVCEGELDALQDVGDFQERSQNDLINSSDPFFNPSIEVIDRDEDCMKNDRPLIRGEPIVFPERVAAAGAFFAVFEEPAVAVVAVGDARQPRDLPLAGLLGPLMIAEGDGDGD